MSAGLPVESIAGLLREGVAGPIWTRPEQLEAYGTNYGNRVRRAPALAVGVSSEAEVVHVLRVARDRRLPVNVRGAGHSFGEQGLCEGGLVIVSQLGEPDCTVVEDAVEVSTRTTWGALERALNRAGRTVPVLTTEPGVSVGGTLAVGGYGAASVRDHCQVDLVRRFRLVRPDGSALWCSPETTPDLFRHGLASLGQLGYVERVVLRTLPYHRRSLVAVRHHAGLRDLVASTTWLLEDDQPGLDFFSGHLGPGGCVSTLGVRVPDGERFRPEGRLAEVFTRDSAAYVEGWPPRRRTDEDAFDPDVIHSWQDYVVDLAHVERFVDFVTARVLTDEVAGRHFRRLQLLLDLHPERKGLFPFEAAHGDMRGAAYGFSLDFNVPRSDAEGWRAVRRLQKETLERCMACGGRPYLASGPPLDEATRRRLYGQSYVEHQRLRREHDPLLLFNSGPL
jgi:FAD/FMN-containing dehydrogenase